MENNINNNESHFPEKPSSQAPFAVTSENFVSFINKKAEKISSAIYILTNLFEDQEPLKWHLRESGISLLNNGASFVDQSQVPQKEAMETLQSNITEILSKLQVAFFGGLLSEMNFRIFKRELESLSTIIRERLKTQYGGVYLLAEDFFKVEEQTLSLPSAPTNPQKNFYKGQNSIKDNVLNNSRKSSEERNSHKGQNSFESGKHNIRREMIMQYLQRVKEASVKDFAVLIKNCSEKTVQRELLQLVADGVLKKVGERRWSKYSLN
jgi:hypothetical protein